MERCKCLPLNSKFARKCPCKNKTVQQTTSYRGISINCLKCCPLVRTHALSLGCHWSMALSMTLCLNSAKNSCFKFLPGSVATLFGWSWKLLPYFVANLSKTLHINFYQNQSSIVEVMIKKFWRVFYASQCSEQTDRRTDRETDRHRWKHDLLTLKEVKTKKKKKLVTSLRGCRSFPAAVRWCTAGQPSREPTVQET